MFCDKMGGFVVGIDTDDLTRFRLFACIYCGDTTQKTRDHVISVAWTGFKRSYSPGDTVASCRECNSLLGDVPLHCISKRASYVASMLESKYRRLLKHPNWTPKELKGMSSQFKFMIKSSAMLKNYIISRITHALLTSLEEINKPNINQHSLREVDVYKILSRCFTGENYEEIEKSLSLEPGKVRKIIQNKEFSSVIIAFKYERNIPFDNSLLKIFAKIRSATRG